MSAPVLMRKNNKNARLSVNHYCFDDLMDGVILLSGATSYDK